MTLTFEQYNKLATKQDLKDLDDKFVTKEEFREKSDQILTAIDGLAKAVRDAQTDQAADLGAHDRLQGVVDNHEIRIKKLETVKI